MIGLGMMNNWGSWGNLGIMNGLWGWLLPLALLDLCLRGFALWRSARNKQNVWFIFLLLVNSAGILPAIYLLTHKETAKK